MKNKQCEWLSVLVFFIALLGFVACSSDSDEEKIVIDTSAVSLYVEGTKTIQGDVNSAVSENEFVAEVDNNVITGAHVGETIVTVNGKYRIPITVIPFYNIMDDPILEWGASTSTIKSKQKQGTLRSDDGKMLAYQKCGDAEALAYNFENDKLKAVLVMFPVSKMSACTGYLKERFAFYPGQFSNYTFLGIDAYSVEKSRTVVALSLYNTNYLACLYMPTEDYKSDASVSKVVKKLTDNEFGFQISN